MLLFKKAQGTAEYAILFSIVVAAAIGMQHSIRRTLQGRMHDAGNFLVEQTSGIGQTGEYEVYAVQGRESGGDTTRTTEESTTEHAGTRDGWWMEKDHSTTSIYTQQRQN